MNEAQEIWQYQANEGIKYNKWKLKIIKRKTFYFLLILSVLFIALIILIFINAFTSGAVSFDNQILIIKVNHVFSIAPDTLNLIKDLINQTIWDYRA